MSRIDKDTLEPVSHALQSIKSVIDSMRNDEAKMAAGSEELAKAALSFGTYYQVQASIHGFRIGDIVPSPPAILRMTRRFTHKLPQVGRV
jgi:hypothetical protein